MPPCDRDAAAADSDRSTPLTAATSPSSRRAFLATAGKLGAALAVTPAFSRGLLAMPTASRAATPEMLADGMLGTAADVGAPTTRAPYGSLYSGLKWRMLGPFRGGRVDAVTGVPGRPNEFYFGAVNGGVWKSIDAGRVWTPVFDSMPIASIGAIAVAPSAPDTVYVGSGESTLRDSVGYGNGMYKTTDAGKSWTHLGLDNTHHIGKIAVDPKNANTLFVAALGHLYAPNVDRGVFRSKDGGKTWQKVLFKNENVGAIDVAIDPVNPLVVYASLWNTRRPPWFTYAPTNGPGGGLYKSVDGGTTWKQMTKGLPAEGIGRSGIAIAPSNPKRVYAVVDCLLPEAGASAPAPATGASAGGGGGGGGRGGAAVPLQGGFFRSDDAGETWTRVSSDQALWGRGWYFEKLSVDPKNADTVFVPNVSVSRTKDGGKTWTPLRGSPGGDDYHQAWISPDDSNTMIVASDQGAIITRNALADDPSTVTWSSWLNQPTAQMYHISVDYRTPYWITGAQQDSGAAAVRIRGKFGQISMRDWEPIGAGGESGMTAGDALHPGIIFGGAGSRFDLESNTDVPGTTTPVSPEPARTDWTQPLVFSKADPKALFYANQFLFQTTDGAATWKVISPDLTRPDAGIPKALDTAAAAQVDRNGKRGVIYTIAPSPLQAPLLWVGTDDGLIHQTTNGGATWQNVTPAAITPWSRITMLEASHTDVNAAYASVDRHQLQDFEPYIYRTRDAGKTWQPITSGLPAGVYVHTIKEDPIRKGLLFAGTERGAFVSFDDGDLWQPLQLNLPVTSVRDFEIFRNDLIVATHGRGVWVIDNMTALRQINDAVAASSAFLFKPADATYVAQGGDNGTPLQKDEPQALNPPNGAIIEFYLRSASTTPVVLDVLDDKGTVLRSFSTDPAAQPAAGGGRGGAVGGGIPNTSPLWRPAPEPLTAAAGMHRVVWTPTSGGGRGFGGGGGRGGAATVLTGNFVAKLTASGQSYTQPFTVKAESRAR